MTRAEGWQGMRGAADTVRRVESVQFVRPAGSAMRREAFAMRSGRDRKDARLARDGLSNACSMSA